MPPKPRRRSVTPTPTKRGRRSNSPREQPLQQKRCTSTSAMFPMTWTTIPADVWAYMAQWLTARDVGALASTCRTAANLFLPMDPLWAQLMRNRGFAAPLAAAAVADTLPAVRVPVRVLYQRYVAFDPVHSYMHIRRAIGYHKAHWTVQPWKDLFDAVSSVQAPFFVASDGPEQQGRRGKGGHWHMDQKRQGQSGKGGHWRLHIDAKDMGPLTKLNLAKIATLATPAPFGKGNETVFDESVRKATEVSGDRVDIVNKSRSWATFMSTGLPKLNALAPPTRYLRVIPYKLHIYGRGGKFDEHSDTPHDRAHIATLVVCLPNPFEGGELVLNHRGQVASFPTPQQREAMKRGKPWWVAFYTDVLHSVQAVTSGTRVVVQYDLYVARSRDDHDMADDDVAMGTLEAMTNRMSVISRPPPRDVTHLLARLQSGVDSWVAHHAHAPGLALPLTHRYSQRSLDPNLLRGADHALWRACCALEGFEGEPVLTLILITTARDYGDDAMVQVFARPVSMLEGVPVPAGLEGPIVMVPGPQFSELVLMAHEDYMEHTGNESAPEKDTYLGAAIVLLRTPTAPAPKPVWHYGRREVVNDGWYVDDPSKQLDGKKH